MLRLPLKKGDSTKPTLPIGWLWFTLLAVQTYNLNSKLPTQPHQLHHLASRTAFSNTITSHRKPAVLWKLSNVTFCRVLHFNRQNLMLISPPNDQASVGQLLLTYGLFYENVATFRTLLTKWIRLWSNRFTIFKLKKKHVFPNVECIFSAKFFSSGNLSLLTYFTKLSSVSNTVTIAHFC